MKKLVGMFLFQLLVITAMAQISGKIVDNHNNGLRGANVHLLNTNFSATTNANGDFLISNVFQGTYTIEASLQGFGRKTETLTVSNQKEQITITLLKAPSVLDEVIVTANKREELLQRTPVSITSLSSTKINEYRLWNNKDLTAIVPNLYSADPGDRRNVTSIRGIATTSYEPAVATYIDGVNQFNLDTYIAQLFDVERIEVLRGPEGTLYGRTAMGGVINIITKQPTNKVDAFGEVTIGNKGLQRYSAGVRSPLIKDKLFIGAAYMFDRSNGFYTNEFNNTKYDKQKSFTGNYYLKFLPTEKLAITLNVKHNNNRNNGPFPLNTDIEGAFTNPYKLNQNATTQLLDNIFNSNLSLNYTGRYLNFTSQTSYQSNYRIYKNPIDADFSPIDGITLINNFGKDWNKVKVYTQEFKFSSPASTKTKLGWTAGAYGFYQDNPVKQTTRFGSDGGLLGGVENSSLINTTNSTSKGVAVYGQATYAVTNRFKLTAGVRYDHEKREQSVLGEFQQDPNPEPVFAYRSDTSATVSFNAVLPKFSASYMLTDKSLVFATFSKGYRPGGLTPLSSDPSQPSLFNYKPEYSNNYEAGLKNTFLNNKLTVNITAFYTNVTEVQVPTLVLPDAITITRNTGKLTSKGVELEASTAISGLQLDYNFGYTNSRYDQLKLPQNGAEIDLKGKSQLFTPDVTSMLAAQYSVPLSKKRDLQLLFRGEWRYLGKQYFDLANTIKQSAYSLINPRIELRAKVVSLILWGRNITNKRYIGFGYDFGAIRLGDPRTYGATVRINL